MDHQTTCAFCVRQPIALLVCFRCAAAKLAHIVATDSLSNGHRSPFHAEGYHRAMGRKNYLIEGVSGAGKTAVCTELQRRGYQAIHGDRELVYRGDPETGRPMALETDPPTAIWMSEHQIWDVEKVQAYVANRKEAVTFF
jgi:hypothetical protein